MTASVIPGETLIQIFNYLKEEDLRHVMRVCRRWRIFAGVRLFKELRVQHILGKCSYSPTFSNIVEDSAHVKLLHLELKSTDGIPRDEAVLGIVKSIQPFSNVRSFSYDDRGLGYLDASPWSVLWKVLDHAITSMPFLVSLSINHVMTNHAWRLYGSCDGWTGPNTPPRRPPNLKEIQVGLVIDGTNVKAVDRFFMRLFATFDKAESLISDVLLRWPTRGFQVYSDKTGKVPYIWRFRNTNRSDLTDSEKSSLPTDLILVDFSKVVMSMNDLKDFSTLSSQLNAAIRESYNSTQEFLKIITP
ncbi:hypothetical protein TWF718_002168 [Orbilia javanica]|uniref:F-box domain-containing protein n=1 Tax=Orbilia javanica TaxID=47235 RepID=A0AAN8RB78_9PEZI